MITAYLQLLLKGYRPQLGSEAEVCVGFIADGAKRMRELLSALLDYTAIDINILDETETVDLNLVFADVNKSLKRSIDESRAVVLSGPLPVVQGYRSHFVQLVQNLISNAIKYCCKKRLPSIQITAEIRDGLWRIAVVVNGVGIAAQYHEKIFGVFKRLHGKAIPGTWLGLAICRRVVERTNGLFWFHSDPDRGPSVHFTRQ